MQTFEHLQVDVAEHIGVLTIDRTGVRNAIDRTTAREMTAALAQLTANDDVGVVILTGAGRDVFVSGADISRRCACRVERKA